MSGDRHAIAAETVFDGLAPHHDRAVIIAGDRIESVVPRNEVPAGLPVQDLPPGAWLAPGFIDVQVNVGGDVLFNDAPSVESLDTIAAAHRRFGTTGLVPTLVSDTPEKMHDAAGAAAATTKRNPAILGIHFEGPFLSPDRPGVHDPAMIRKPSSEDMALLTAPRDGVTMVTLAPEEVPQGFVRALADAGIRVCLGHSMASYDETRTAIADGLAGITHLFNAMRPMAARAPGPIPAALETPHLHFGMIVDGVHVDPAMLRLALRGRARAMLVTDAMPPVGGNRPGFKLYGQEITVREGRCIRADGTLAGAALDMATAVRNAVETLDMPLTDALRAASAEPAGFLGIDAERGHLAPGCRADMVAFAPRDMTILGTWLSGAPDKAFPDR